MASRSWPHGTATTLSAVNVVPVGAPVVLEVPAAVPVVVPMVPVVPVVVSAVKVAVSAVPVVVLVVVGLVGLVVVVSVVSVVLGAAVRSHAPSSLSPCFTCAASAGLPTVIRWPLWQRVTFSWPGPPSS